MTTKKHSIEYYIFYRKIFRKNWNFLEVDPRIRIRIKIKCIQNTGHKESFRTCFFFFITTFTQGYILYIFHFIPQGGIIIFKHFGGKYDEREKKKGEKGENIYIFPQLVQYLLGEKYPFGKGGREEYHFGDNVYPCIHLVV